MTKTVYEAPAIAELGSFEDLTRATNAGPSVDQALPQGAPIAGHLS